MFESRGQEGVMNTHTIAQKVPAVVHKPVAHPGLPVTKPSLAANQEGANATVLVVDPDSSTRALVEGCLKLYGYRVVGVKNGADALRAAESARPDIILLNQKLTDMSGLDVLLRLKRHADLKGLPVLMITDHAERENVVRASRLGASDFLVQPLQPQVIREKVGRAWNLAQLERRARVARGEGSSVTLERVPGISVFHLEGLMGRHTVERFLSLATPNFLRQARNDEIAFDLVSLVEMSDESQKFLEAIFAHVRAAYRRPRVIAGRHYARLLNMGLDPERQIFLMMDHLVKHLEKR